LKDGRVKKIESKIETEQEKKKGGRKLA